MKVRARVIVISLLIAASLVGCMAQEEEVVTEDTTVQIAYFIPVKGNSYTKALTDGAEAVAQEMNAEITVFSSEYDQSLQNDQIEDAITSGKYNAFIINAVDSMGVLPGVESAAEAGILVGAADTIIGPNTDAVEPYEGITTIAGLTWATQGQGFGEMVLRGCEGKDPCKVVYLVGMQGMTADQDRLSAMKEVLADHPEIELVDVQEASYLQDEALNVMQNVFQSHPDIDVVATAGDQMSLGAAQAAEDAGLAGSVKIYGNGASEQGVQALKDGTLDASYALVPYTVGEVVAENLIMAVRGQEFETAVDVSQLSPPLPASGAIIDQDTVDEFEAQW